MLLKVGLTPPQGGKGLHDRPEQADCALAPEPSAYPQKGMLFSYQLNMLREIASW
jgi:hypothetical protein